MPFNQNVILVVKKFGLHGGMEEYVFRLCQELAKMDVKVQTICESVSSLSMIHPNVEIILLRQWIKKPRWLNHLFFSFRVSKWIKRNADQLSVIHSHERLNCHHITTIHSTLYNYPATSLFPTIRNLMNQYIEKRELRSTHLQKIVPVSTLISDQIKVKYPDSYKLTTKPITPAVTPFFPKKLKLNPRRPIIGFMGKEWKRKGLIKVINVWREIRKELPDAKLCVAGVQQNKMMHIHPDELNFIEFLGYIDKKEDFFSKINILLHPARKEAYGMVIAESLSVDIPVVCSMQCGAAFDDNINPVVLDVMESDKIWAQKTIKTLGVKCENNSNYNWNILANEYVKLYKDINPTI